MKTIIANLKSDSTTISSFQYSYDNAGNRTRVIDESATPTTWSYDATNHLHLRCEW
ncbi:hypothetical protein [Gimesia sp.]|uniref:hypothetical protein n=1 Tax=Gimesia sp. TaxID=2024833 RepID=UPI003A947356